ncbi:MAG: GntR family transcriptional regulator [Pseudomonadota bacterium]
MTAVPKEQAERAPPLGDEKPSPSRKEVAYQSLRKRILSDGFQAGAFIDDSREAERLGMSRTPVREALLLLEAEGLVEMMPRRAVRVVPLTRNDVRDVIVLLTALEIAAVELLAAKRPDAETLRPLSDACVAMEKALKVDDPDQWLEADEDFHRGLMTLSGNRHLAATGIKYRDKIRRGHFIASRLLPRSRRVGSTKIHKALVALLLSDDPQAAVEAHRRQRLDGESEIMATLDRAKLDSL